MTATDSRPGTVLDFLPHGRTDDNRPGYEREPLAYALDSDEFRLYELIVDETAAISIGDTLAFDADTVSRFHEIGYDDLPSGAASECEYLVEDIVEEEQERFVAFYNDAQPITLRLHQLNLLPGIGKKLRNDILDERKRSPFESFAELEERIDGLHAPKEVLVERIIEELKEEDLKYRIFVGQEE